MKPPPRRRNGSGPLCMCHRCETARYLRRLERFRLECRDVRRAASPWPLWVWGLLGFLLGSACGLLGLL